MIESLSSAAAAQSVVATTLPQSQPPSADPAGSAAPARGDSASFSPEALAMLHAEHGPKDT